MPRRRKTGGPKLPRVLVVDGSESHLEQISVALREAGFEVLAVARTEALLPLSKAFQPSVVLLATHAPEFHSVQVARRFQELSRGAIPILYLLDAPDPELRGYCLERGHGMDALSKPLDLRELVAKVGACVRLRDAVAKAQDAESAGQKGAALRDPVTGVFRKRTLLAFVGHELRRGERAGSNCALVVVRLQAVQAMSEEGGREAIHRYLTLASATLVEAVRGSDVVGRVDEETFAVLFPDMSLEGLPTALARLARNFEEARYTLDGSVVKSPVALGAASFPELVGTPAQMLSAALVDLKRSRERSPAAVLEDGVRLALS